MKDLEEMTEIEEQIVHEAYRKLRSELKCKLEAFEKGYVTCFDDYEIWYEKFAPYTWAEICKEFGVERGWNI